MQKKVVGNAFRPSAEIKAVASGNPLIREKMETDNEVQRLTLLKASYDSQRYSFQDNFMIRFPKLLASVSEKLNSIQEDIRQRDKILLQEPDFSFQIGNRTFQERADAGAVFLQKVSEAHGGETRKIGNYKGFDVAVEKNWMGCDYLVLFGRTEYKAELSTSAVGNMLKVENLFQGLESQEELLKKRLEQYKRDMEQSRLEYDKPFPYELELKEKLKRQFELNAMLDLEHDSLEEEKTEREEEKELTVVCR